MLNNSTILDSPILLFLGAGASQPLEKPMMGEFLKKVESLIRGEEERATLRDLVRFRGIDLEGILGELDTIIGLNYASTISGIYQLHEREHTSFSLSTATAWSLRSKIKHEIIREYRNVDSDKAVKVYGPLFDVLFSKLPKGNQCITIFTTNYDPAIEEFYRSEHDRYGLCDGFDYDPADRHTYWSRSVFDKFAPQPSKRNIVLFKLHGSVDWVRVKSSQKIRRGQAMFDSMDSDAYENILIYPATRKIATEDPYYTGYEYFERCCERAKVCLAIGYSFRDYDGLTRLRGAASVNDSLNLALLAPTADEVLKGIQIPNDRKTAIIGKFGESPDQLDPLSEYLEKTIGKP